MLARALTPFRLLAAALVVIVAALVILLTRASDHYLEIPDEAHPLASLVTVEGARPRRDHGGVYYVDVLIRRASLLESLIPALRPDGSDLIPRKALLGPCVSISEKERDQLELADMKLSQVKASTVALRALGYRIPVRLGGVRVVAVSAGSHARGVVHTGDVIVAADGERIRVREQLRAILGRHRVGDTVRLGILRDGKRHTFAIRTTSDRCEPQQPIIGVIPAQALRVHFPFRIHFDLGGVGGPSAGLAFALELMEKRGHDVDHGYRIAATGEIQLDGKVTRIGGVKEKTLGARAAHVDAFLVPVDGDNARIAKRYAHGLRIIPVESFQQALRALATLPQKT